MMTVTTQAPNGGKGPAASQKVQEHIKKLSFGPSQAIIHADDHATAGLFDPLCGHCIYWAVKVVQNSQTWGVNTSGIEHMRQQVINLRQIPLGVVNHVVITINDAGYSRKIKAREMDAQEYLQVVASQ